MNSFFRGFLSIFSWFDCYNNISPSERVEEILDDFYLDHPWIERDDMKALENDFKSLNHYDLYPNLKYPITEGNTLSNVRTNFDRQMPSDPPPSLSKKKKK